MIASGCFSHVNTRKNLNLKLKLNRPPKRTSPILRPYYMYKDHVIDLIGIGNAADPTLVAFGWRGSWIYLDMAKNRSSVFEVALRSNANVVHSWIVVQEKGDRRFGWSLFWRNLVELHRKMPRVGGL